MMAALLHAAALAPASLPWLHGIARQAHAITLATLRRWRYSSQVPDKEAVAKLIKATCFFING